MKNNVIAASIIACAILAVALLYNRSTSGIAEQFLTQLEKAAVVKDVDGKTQIAKIMEGFSKSTASGFLDGFAGGQNDRLKSQMPILEKIVFKEVHVVPGGQRTQEKVIGIVKNESNETISDINVVIIFRNADGSLLDVTTQSNQVPGTLKPGTERAFEFKRDLGSFSAKDEELAKNKAAKVELTAVRLSIIK